MTGENGQRRPAVELGGVGNIMVDDAATENISSGVLDAPTLADIAAGVDLPAILTDLSGPGRPSGAGWLFRCPHPDHPDQRPSFSVYQAGDRWRASCWSQCGWHGDAIDLIVWLEGCSIGEAAQQLQRSWVPVKRSARTAPPTIIYTAQDVTAGHVDRPDLLDRYVNARGWPADVIDRFDLTVIVDAAGRHRIRHPFHVPDGAGGWIVAGWQDRAIDHSLPKWSTTKGVSLPLFNLRQLGRSTHVATVVICEGPADTITAAVAVADDPTIIAVGVAGSSAWRQQWATLFRNVTVIVAADPDQAGQRFGDIVRDSIRRPIWRVSLTAGDLTDTANQHGLDHVRRLLTPPTSKQVGADLHHPVEPVAVDEVWRQHLHLEQLGPCRWTGCNSCGQVALIRRRPRRRCILTPGCTGFHTVEVTA